MGIGLAVCRGLVEAHGGQLTAYNREGGGAVFQIRLPAGESTKHTKGHEANRTTLTE
jgi:signal transduction histidine kinase